MGYSNRTRRKLDTVIVILGRFDQGRHCDRDPYRVEQVSRLSTVALYHRHRPGFVVFNAVGDLGQLRSRRLMGGVDDHLGGVERLPNANEVSGSSIASSRTMPKRMVVDKSFSIWHGCMRP